MAANRAMKMQQQGLYREAEPGLLKAITVLRASLPSGHPDLTNALHNAGLGYWRQGRFAEAEGAFREVLETGAATPAIAPSMVGLGIVFSFTGRLPAAERALKQAIATDPSNVAAWKELADVYRLKHQLNEAERSLRKAIQIAERSRSSNPKIEALLHNSFGLLHLEQGRIALAAAEFNLSLNAVVVRDSDAAITLRNLAEVRRLQRRLGEAGRLISEAVAIHEAVDRSTRELVSSLLVLARVRGAEGKFGEAERIVRRSLALSESLSGGFPLRAGVRSDLADLLRRRRAYTEAAPLFQTALAEAEQDWGPDHPVTASILERYAELLRHLKRKQEAGLMADRAKSIRLVTPATHNVDVRDLFRH